MKISILILEGKRRGDAFELNLIDGKHTPSLFILEDEAIEINFSSEKYYDDIYLLLHENEIKPTLVENVSNLWTYKWLPKRLGRFSYECFFHNYYGIAELAIETRDGDKIDIFSYQPIEVLAKKINADRVDKMLSYIEKVDSEALYAFFRVTRRKGGFDNGDTPAVILLEQVENIVEITIALISKILKRPIYKLSIQEKYVYPSDNTNIDDLTLSWLCSNTDELFETDSYENAILEFNDEFYSAKKLIEHQAVEDSDVYENQVLHGFVITLIQTTSSLLSGFKYPDKLKSKTNGGPVGYVSFFSQIKNFQQSINGRKILKCKAILSNLHSIKRMMLEKMPTKKYIIGIPTFTMKAKRDTLYLSVFKKIVDWYRFGKPDWSVQEELLSIQSIPKLFEYYSLFYLREILEQRIGYKSDSETTSESTSFVFNLRGGLTLRLLYEPKYWMPKHTMADLRGLVNSEGWSNRNGIINPRSNKHIFSHRSPDFVIHISNGYSINKYLILDAKYTSSEKAFLYYLPELTLKYLHGLHSVNDINSSVLGLIILNPDEAPLVRNFHNSSFDIYSDNPVMPCLLCASISPGEENVINNHFPKSLMKILDIMEDQFQSVSQD